MSKPSKNFIRDGIEVSGYFAENKLTDAFRFWYRPMPPKAAEVEIHLMETMEDEPDKKYDILVQRFLKHVTRWDFEEPLNIEFVLMLNRNLLWRANRLILGNDRGDVDPDDKKAKDDSDNQETGASIVGKSDERTS